MSNNKQSMKLYTEEQLLEAYELGHGLTKEEVLEEFIPISETIEQLLIIQQLQNRKQMEKGYACAIFPMFVFIKHTNGSKEFILGWLNKTINLTFGGNK